VTPPLPAGVRWARDQLPEGHFARPLLDLLDRDDDPVLFGAVVKRLLDEIRSTGGRPPSRGD